jgi:hypothetical protein
MFISIHLLVSAITQARLKTISPPKKYLFTIAPVMQ